MRVRALLSVDSFVTGTSPWYVRFGAYLLIELSAGPGGEFSVCVIDALDPTSRPARETLGAGGGWMDGAIPVGDDRMNLQRKRLTQFCTSNRNPLAFARSSYV